MSESAGMSQQTGAHAAENLSNRLDELNRQIASSMEMAVQEFHRDLSDLTDKAGTDGRQKAANALLEAFARIDEEESQSGVLIALLEEGRRFASRTAFFLLQPTQVVVWGSRGFGDDDNTIASRTIDQGSPWDDLAEGGGSLTLDAATCQSICSQLDTEAAEEALLVPFVIRGQLGGAFYADRVEGDGALLFEALQLLTHDASQAVELVAVRNRGASPALRRGAGQAEKLSVWQPEPSTPESSPAPESAPVVAEPETITAEVALPQVDSASEAPASEPMAAVEALAATHLPQSSTDAEADAAVEPAPEPLVEAAPIEEPVIEELPVVEEPPAVEEVPVVDVPDIAATPEAVDTEPAVDASPEIAPALPDISAATQPDPILEAPVDPEPAPTFAEPEPVAPAFTEPEPAAPTFAEPEPVAPTFAEPEPAAPTFAEPEPVAPALTEPEPPAVAEPVATPELASPSFASDSFAASSTPTFESAEPAPADLADESIPEPELEDTSTDIWSLEEDDDDDEPTVVGQQAVVPTAPAAAEPAAPEPVAPQPAAPEPALAMDGVGQETVRLDLAALQGQASAAFGAGAPVAPQPVAPEPVAPEPVAPQPLAPQPAAPVSTSFAQPETAYVPPPAPEPAAAPSFTDPASGGFVPPEPKPEPAASGSNEVRPPEDHQGPGLAFASSTSSDDAHHEEARRLARLLVSEIKLYNEEVIEEGKRHGDIYERLKDDIDRSRQMYQERIHPKLQSQDDYFYQELVQRLAGGDASLLGMSP